jgi:hypothetical protein
VGWHIGKIVLDAAKVVDVFGNDTITIVDVNACNNRK